MGLYKKGTFIGKTDRMGNEILSGDTLKKLGYGTLFVVNKYGGLSDESGIPLISAKHWHGEDYEVVITLTSPDEAQPEASVQEEKATAPAMVDYDKTIKNLTEELGQAADCVRDMEKELAEKNQLIEDMQKTIDSLNQAALRLQEERDAACKAQVNAESLPLSAYTLLELLAEVKQRDGWMDYVTNDEIKEELRRRGFVGNMVRSYTVTMHETIDLTEAAAN